ncbi:MAG: PIG-L family deacetylase [Gammaproteobacteria bacterium]|nr:PIG-L family deacetylase [Gammaproteobacteria bacterium]
METRLTPYQASPLIECTAALVFAPHPDDEALGCGGLVCAYKAAGIPVTAVIVTSGDHGEHGKAGADVREQESRNAAELLGIANVIFWREPDRGVAYNERTIAAAQQAILDCNADLVIAPSTSEIHPDHRATAWIAIEAARRLVTAGKTLRVALYEIGSPLPRVNVLVDITAHEATKRSAVGCYGSQLAIARYDELIMGLNRFRSYTLPAEVKFAEAYRLLQTEELLQPVLIAEPELHRQERLNLVNTRSQQEKVSVLIRSMDRPSLSRALDSVALQTWSNIEVVVLNAKGPGHSVLESRAGTLPLRFIDSATNVPRSQAANLLLENTNSDLAIFLDDDDWFAPDHIARLVDHLRDNPNASAAFSGVEFGQLVKTEDAQERWQVKHQFNATYDACRLLFENYLPIHSVLFRVQQVRDDWACRFDTAMDVFEDWDFWLQISNQGAFSGTGHVSAFYNFNTSDGSGVFSAPEANKQRVQQLQEKWFARLSPARYSRLMAYTQDLYRELADKMAQVGELVEHQRITEEAARIHEENLKTSAQEQADGLKAMLASRDDEINNYQTHTRGLEDILAARDVEIAQVRASLETLQAATRSRRWLLGKLLVQNKS